MRLVSEKTGDALQIIEMKMATKRHKRRNKIEAFVCFLCLFVARDPVSYLPP